jgi:hypothetical protein
LWTIGIVPAGASITFRFEKLLLLCTAQFVRLIETFTGSLNFYRRNHVRHSRFPHYSCAVAVYTLVQPLAKVCACKFILNTRNLAQLGRSCSFRHSSTAGIQCLRRCRTDVLIRCPEALIPFRWQRWLAPVVTDGSQFPTSLLPCSHRFIALRHALKRDEQLIRTAALTHSACPSCSPRRSLGKTDRCTAGPSPRHVFPKFTKGTCINTSHPRRSR